MLSAVISGAAGQAGENLWDRLVALVRRPFHGRQGSGSGNAELVALEQAKDDHALVLELSRVLTARADSDDSFADGLDAWLSRARKAIIEMGAVSNTISGGHQTGPVIQGRDFHGVNFNSVQPTSQQQSPNASKDHDRLRCSENWAAE